MKKKVDNYQEAIEYIKELNENGNEVTTYQIDLSDKYSLDKSLTRDTYDSMIREGIRDFESEGNFLSALLGLETKIVYH